MLSFKEPSRIGMTNDELLIERDQGHVYFSSATPLLGNCKELKIAVAAGETLARIDYPVMCLLVGTGAIMGDSLTDVIWLDYTIVAAALDRVFQTLTILGFKTTAGMSASAAMKRAKEARISASPAQRLALTLESTDLQRNVGTTETDGSRTVQNNWLDTITFCGDGGWCSPGKSAEAWGEVEYLCGVRFLPEQRKTGSTFLKGTAAISAQTWPAAKYPTDLDMQALEIAGGWKLAIWPEGLHCVQANFGLRVLALAKRFAYAADPKASSSIFAERLGAMLGVCKYIAAGIEGIEEVSEIRDIVDRIATALKVASSSPHTKFSRTEALIVNMPAVIRDRGSNSVQEWEAEMLKYLATPATGNGSSSFDLSLLTGAGGGNQSLAHGKNRLQLQTEVVDAIVYSAQHAALKAGMLEYRKLINHKPMLILEWLLKGKTPTELLPIDGAERAIIQQREIDFKPLAFYHQIAWGKINPVTVVPDLHFLAECRTEDVWGSLLAHKAIKTYLGASTVVPACLQTLKLTGLFKALKSDSWDDIDWWRLVDAPIVGAFNSVTVDKLSVLDATSDVYLISRLAPSVQAIADTLMIDERAGTSVQALWQAPSSAAKLYLNIDADQTLCLRKQTASLINGTTREVGVVYALMRNSASQNAVMVRTWMQPGSPTLLEWETHLGEVEHWTVQRRTRLANSSQSIWIRTPQLTSFSTVSAGAHTGARQLPLLAGNGKRALGDDTPAFGGLCNPQNNLVSFQLKQGDKEMIFHKTFATGCDFVSNQSGNACWWTCFGYKCPWAGFPGHSVADHEGLKQMKAAEFSDYYSKTVKPGDAGKGGNVGRRVLMTSMNSLIYDKLQHDSGRPMTEAGTVPDK